MSDSALIAGFDAGQTHSRCRLARVAPNGRRVVLAEGEGSGVSHLDAAGGEQRFSAAIASSFGAAWDALKQQGGLDCTPGDLAAAAIGASGIEAGSSVQPRGERLAAAALGLRDTRVLVTGDERTALEGARGSEPAGVLLISGTGCIALGRNGTGALHRCGGWGWLLDGAGSACDIGRDGLALSLQMADGRRRDTGLRAALWASLGVATGDPGAPQTIKALVVEPGFGAAGFARLAPVVHQQALGGDADALAIVQRSAQALAVMASSIATHLRLNTPPIWVSGGALEHLTLLRNQLKVALTDHCPGAHLAPSAGDACDGALQLAQTLTRR